MTDISNEAGKISVDLHEKVVFALYYPQKHPETIGDGPNGYPDYVLTERRSRLVSAHISSQ